VAAAVATRMSRITQEHINNLEGAKAVETMNNGGKEVQPPQSSKIS